ncbi:hypothetical protein N665_0025s0115 [Sinapis alba]|nr:hypothetical protein N665_0025s0115 [Sinapis alba]
MFDFLCVWWIHKFMNLLEISDSSLSSELIIYIPHFEAAAPVLVYC